MLKKVKCLHCNTNMLYIRSEKLQLGETGLLMGHLSNLVSGALDVDIYTCKECGKIEFFQTESNLDTEDIAQKECPNCGETHDFDYAKCPFCKYDYYA